MGALWNNFSSICESINLLTNLVIDSSVYSGSARDAASTVSAIISMAVSFENGLGPGYEKAASSISLPGLAFFHEL